MLKKRKPVDPKINKLQDRIALLENKLVHYQEITKETRRMKNLLKKSANEWRNTFDAMTDMIIVMDRDYRITRANKMVCRNLGLGFKDIIGRSCYQLILGADEALDICPIKDAIETGNEQTVELFVGKLNKYFLISSHPLLDETGQKRILAVLRDITFHKRSEEAIRRSEEKFRSLFNNTNDAIFIRELEGRFLDVNVAACERLGYSREELLQMNPGDLDAPEVTCSFIQRTEEIKRNGKGIFETVHLTKEKKRIPIEISAKIINYDGRPIILSIARDISERKRAEDSLRQSEETYKGILGTSIDGFWIDDLQGFIREANEACSLVLGYSRDELLKMKISDLVVDENPKEIAARIKKIMETGGDRFEAILRRKDGKVLDFEFSVNYADILGGRLFVFFRDITTRKNMEEALRKSEERFRMISENTSDLVSVINRKGIIIYASPSYRQLGYDSEEVLGKIAIDFVCAEDKERILGMLQLLAQASKDDLKEIANGRKTDRFTYGIYRNNGVPVFIESTTNIVVDKKTDDFNVLFVSRDITTRKNMEEALRKSEERFRMIAENTSDLIAVVNSLGEYIYTSPSYWRLGFKPNDLLGKSAFDFVHPEDRDKILPYVIEFALSDPERLSQLKFEQGSKWFSCRSFDQAGGIRHLEITADLIKSDKGFDILLISRDVTEKVKMEEEVLKVAKLQSLATLSAGIAHDFNNLLAAILGNVSVGIASTEPGSDLHELMKDVETASKKASGLVQQLITFSRGGDPIKKRMIVGKLVQEQVELLVGGTGVEAVFSIASGLWPIEVDVEQFRQVINNITKNAIQAMPGGGKIHISVENQSVDVKSGLNIPIGDYVKITFSDQGVGISPENVLKIFDPFFTTRPESSGLGLSTVYSIIRKHGGHITVDSRDGAGAIFRIYFPTQTEEKAKSAIPKSINNNAVKRILVMDDEEIVKKAAGRMLRSMGYEVEFAKNGKEAIDIYLLAKENNQPFSAVIIDLTIPGGMGGKAAIQRLLEIDPHVKAIVSSGYSDDPIMSEYRKHGFAGIIPKPYNYKEMEEVVKNVIDNG